jgi:hypothetical protein
METQTDIEIYIQGATLDDVEQWLSGVFEVLDLERQHAGTMRGSVALDESTERCELLVLEKAVKGFTSVWFKQNQTPWDDDLECARSAWHAMQRQVRACAGGWREGEEADLFHRIDSSGESTQPWRTD